MNFSEHATDQQLYIYEKYKGQDERFSELFIAALALADEARNAIVPLPHTNERGNPVFHGCNMQMDRIANAYYSLALMVADNMDRENVYRISQEMGFTLGRGVHHRPGEENRKGMF